MSIMYIFPNALIFLHSVSFGDWNINPIEKGVPVYNMSCIKIFVLKMKIVWLVIYSLMESTENHITFFVSIIQRQQKQPKG